MRSIVLKNITYIITFYNILDVYKLIGLTNLTRKLKCLYINYSKAYNHTEAFEAKLIVYSICIIAKSVRGHSTYFSFAPTVFLFIVCYNDSMLSVVCTWCETKKHSTSSST